MRSKTRLVTALVVMVALFVTGITVTLAQRGPHKDFGGGPMMGRMFKNLDLTDQQRTEIKKVLETERSIMQPIHQQLRENREALDTATKDGQFNEAEVTSLAEKQGDLMAQMIVSRERVQSQIWQILTPEQREKTAQWREKGRKGAGQDGGQMFQRGPRNR